MDIKATIEETVKKITGDKALIEKFKADPIGTVKSTVGVALPDDALNKIVEAVKAKIDLGKLGGIADKIKNLF